MLPVNSGNTILIQADNDPFQGVYEDEERWIVIWRYTTLVVSRGVQQSVFNQTTQDMAFLNLGDQRVKISI